MAKEDAPRRVTLFDVLAWIFSIFFGIPAIFFLFSGAPLAGFWLLLAALVLFPPLTCWLREKNHVELSRTLRTVLAVILFVLYAVSMSKSALVHPSSVPAPTEAVPTQTPPAPAPTPPARIRRATIAIDHVTTSYANLQPIRVTVTNTGDVSITPKFDVTVTDATGAEVCAGSPMFDDFSLLAPGKSETGEFSVTGCSFRRDGTYEVHLDLLDGDYTKLASDLKPVTVQYWSS